MKLDIIVTESMKSRFYKHIVVNANGCWIWQGAKDRSGYGYFSITHEKHMVAHKFAFLYLADQNCPEGMVCGHECDTPSCANPDHIRAITQSENVQKSRSKITHCPKGHEYSPENTYVWKRMRSCRACGRIKQRAYHAGRRIVA